MYEKTRRDPKPMAYVHEQEPTDAPLVDSIICRVCGAYNSQDVEPGGGFPTTLQVTGSTYSWTNSNDAIADIDLEVLPVTNPQMSCWFCGSTRLFDGMKGRGQ